MKERQARSNGKRSVNRLWVVPIDWAACHSYKFPSVSRHGSDQKDRQDPDSIGKMQVAARILSDAKISDFQRQVPGLKAARLALGPARGGWYCNWAVARQEGFIATKACARWRNVDTATLEHDARARPDMAYI